MSRTYKDVSWKFSKERAKNNTVQIPYNAVYVTPDGEEIKVVRYCYLKVAGVLPKLKRSHCDRHYMPTPSWWTRLWMNRPQRAANTVWERKVLFEDLEDTDPPSVGRKPHMYYW